ncbi:hypothetical protein SAMN04515691_1847 [Leifsonia sp. 98AMF]|uniref:hypothetical protein n=1 Tax=unclassified Leifsonia TaxID=2663824 RepID=UPI00087A6342|nr:MULTISPECIES: hypothetical protein [unclassified Leifsonia]SDH35277.1 hypothetical protein SAMN04515690_2172 [Leifsonia sp. 197AMF]SDJ00328.1 hypothetical protein SAMN04515684_1614 [Leifsonia sp. 466MF]SDJ74011.1 hypothetical protein SAMN04515683_1133 [Leifsonia sp. 157MF]SDO03621.1 hypothetical protein SAMN04515686_3817 [Leifsonia sp. 509MF]SEN00414.1 hypothetical protein SAMN04515685_1119 [Leifsonia sp. 467MF]
MSRIRNAVLAGVLVAGLGGGGVLAATPAYATPVVTLAGGTLTSATGTAGETLDMAMTGPVWNFSEPVSTIFVNITVPAGTTMTPGTTYVDDVRYDLSPLSGSPATTWRLSMRAANPALTLNASSISILTIPISQTTPAALQGAVTYEIVRLTPEATRVAETITGAPTVSATFTWTDTQVDTPVLSTAIGGAATVAALGASGIVLLRRRNAEQA